MLKKQLKKLCMKQDEMRHACNRRKLLKRKMKFLLKYSNQKWFRNLKRAIKNQVKRIKQKYFDKGIKINIQNCIHNLEEATKNYDNQLSQEEDQQKQYMYYKKKKRLSANRKAEAQQNPNMKQKWSNQESQLSQENQKLQKKQVKVNRALKIDRSPFKNRLNLIKQYPIRQYNTKKYFRPPNKSQLQKMIHYQNNRFPYRQLNFLKQNNLTHPNSLKNAQNQKLKYNINSTITQNKIPFPAALYNQQNPYFPKLIYKADRKVSQQKQLTQRLIDQQFQKVSGLQNQQLSINKNNIRQQELSPIIPKYINNAEAKITTPLSHKKLAQINSVTYTKIKAGSKFQTPPFRSPKVHKYSQSSRSASRVGYDEDDDVYNFENDDRQNQDQVEGVPDFRPKNQRSLFSRASAVLFKR